MPPARRPDAQAGCPARGIARRKGLFQAFVDVVLGDGILPRLSHSCCKALPLFMLCAPGRRASRTGCWIGHASVPACVSIALHANQSRATLISDSQYNAGVRWRVPHAARTPAGAIVRAERCYFLGCCFPSLSARSREVLSSSACCLAKYSDIPADTVSPAATVRNMASARAFTAADDSPMVNDPIAISKQVNADGSNRGNFK